MRKETRKFLYDKDTEHSRVYKESPPPGTPPIIGKIFVQLWFAGEAKEITLTVEVTP